MVTGTASARNLSSFGETITNTNVTAEEVESAEQAWGDGLLKISKDYKSDGVKQATLSAESFLDKIYDYGIGPVLFEPTLTIGNQVFRTTREGALSYLVGGNKKFPNDTGFGLKGWVKYEFKNAAVFINGDMALTMGNVLLTDGNGKVTKVDKTWGFKKDEKGQLRIVLHHLSLPYLP